MTEAATGGAAVIDALVAHGVRDVFGIPGTHNLELYRYLPQSGIRHVVTRHEQGAGYAADGYARVSGRPGVFITTSGPGITNAMTALGTSYADSIATLAISPGPPRGQVGRDVGWLHEVKDQQAALDAVCARSLRIESADDIHDAIASIFEGFATTRPRPVHLEIPVDVLEGAWSRRRVTVAPQLLVHSDCSVEIARVAAMVAAARCPVLIAGGGARAAASEILGFADRGVPVLTTVNGKGLLDERHPSALGASMRLTTAHALANEADVLLVVGSELGDSDLWGGAMAAGAEGKRCIVRVDIDPQQIDKNVPAGVGIVGHAAQVLRGILTSLDENYPDSAWNVDIPMKRRQIAEEAAADGRPWAEIQASLEACLPDDTVVAGDSSQVTYYGTVHHWPFTPANRLLYPTGYATLGYGLPAAIGAKVAMPDRPVLGLFGDGAAMFSIQELVTAVELGLPLPIVIVDNGGYAEIKMQMLERDMQPLGVDLSGPDFPALARAMGARGVSVDRASEIGRHAREAMDADVPTVIYFRVP